MNLSNISSNPKMPKHIALIIDGNGRWATNKSMPRMLGHRAGIEAVKSTIENSEKIGIKELIFFCFSTENWNRPKPEVEGLFDLFREFLKQDIDTYLDKNIKFKLCGERTRIPQDLIKKVEEIEEKTKSCNKMTVCLCINYGGRDDIVQAVYK